ncbi:phage tail sheath subtilisin-like domain-containing protein [Altericroceibacterium endophyticum]|uniref:Phage tail protein n=1 Tax=Altericroceibacterium endophyticum TaxID=1808508 RepID=A0A6I4T8P6_9SPHN|nr:phage tail sheath subtilisin-like domain-containing protein [Altericroceibacterium endophyticum]MXO66260.1 phage tail protein [Altericroceibacterium endophyticum]
MTYSHGITINEISATARPIAALSTAVIGMVSVADDADAETFPLNRPVLIEDVTQAIGKAGDNGTLAPSLSAIADQASPPAIIVRVEEGADEEETAANILGTTTAEGHLTGMQALLGAESQFGLRPRILGTPGLDTLDVATGLATLARKLRGFAYCAAQGETLAEVQDYRQNFSAREQMLIWPEFSDFTGSAIARALGLRSRIDQETGWHKTLSNVAINGVTGLSRPVPFSILGDQPTTASLLNDADITTLVRLDGYRFWGNRTCSDDPLFAFESAARTAQVLQDTIADGLTWAIDKPIVPALIRDITESINAKFRDMQAQELIIGAEASFRESDNSPAAIAAGKLVFDYTYTPCAPAESITLTQRISERFYAQLLSA